MTERIRTVVVDDEPPARRKLVGLLARWPAIEVAGEAGDGLEAIRVIEAVAPELVFLDVRMPEVDGFGVLASLDQPAWPAIVFVTAYDDFAVRAFEVGALDYVLKPVTAERLTTAVDRVLARIAARSAEPERVRLVVGGLAREAPLERFVVRSLGRLRVVAAGEVHWIEAAGNYVKLHTASGVHLVRGTLQDVEARLDPARFVRIHRSTVVALPQVRWFEPAGHGDYSAELLCGTRLVLSRRFRERLPPALLRR